MSARLQLWKPVGLPGVTLFCAERYQQQFARHSHEEYALGVITGGVLGFDYRGARHLAGRGEINIVVPGEMHTGQPALGDHWSYRMFYIQPAVMQDIARQCGRENAQAPFFSAGVLKDKRLAAAIGALHHDLDDGGVCELEAQSRLISLLAGWIRRYGEKPRCAPRLAKHAPRVTRVRDFLEDSWWRKPALKELADMVGLSPYQLLRAFMRQYGLPPHAYLIQRQVREARRLLDAGLPIAAVTCDAGFADQSHLNRHFKRVWGLTPGQYRNFVQDGWIARH